MAFYIKLFLSILRWIPGFLLAAVSGAVAVLMSPLIALPIFVYKAEESKTTGYPSMLPGQPREFLYWPLSLLTTFDAPVDEWFWAGYHRGTGWAENLTKEQYEASAWIRYKCRIAWICRNPAYGVSHTILGYSQRDWKLLAARDYDYLWKSGYNNFSYWVYENKYGEIGWCIEWQWFFYKDRCLEVYIGWKIHRSDPDQICMLAGRITPFKSYSIQE